MLPKCLENLIGVNCNTDTPTSGKFITDLFGINIRYAAAITDQMQSGIDFLREKIAFATELVVADLQQYLWPYFRVSSIVDELRAGDWGTSFISPAPLNRGIRFQVHHGRLLRIRVSTIELRIQEASTPVVVKITDGTEVTNYAGTTDGDGKLYLTPNFLSKTNEIFITVDNTAITTNNTAIQTGCGCASRVVGHISGAGWNGSAVVGTTYGLQAQAVAECSMEEMACILGPRLELPVLYKSGMETVLAAKTSDRLNSLTMISDEKAEIMMGEFSASYEKYFKSMVASIPELMKRLDDCCVVCNQSRYVEGHP